MYVGSTKHIRFRTLFVFHATLWETENIIIVVGSRNCIVLQTVSLSCLA